MSRLTSVVVTSRDELEIDDCLVLGLMRERERERERDSPFFPHYFILSIYHHQRRTVPLCSVLVVH